MTDVDIQLTAEDLGELGILHIEEPWPEARDEEEIYEPLRQACESGVLRDVIEQGRRLVARVCPVPPCPSGASFRDSIAWAAKEMTAFGILSVFFKATVSAVDVARRSGESVASTIRSRADDIQAKVRNAVSARAFSQRMWQFFLWTGVGFMALALLTTLLVLIGLDAPILGLSIAGYRPLALACFDGDLALQAMVQSADQVSFGIFRVLLDFIVFGFIGVSAGTVGTGAQAFACRLFRLKGRECASLMSDVGVGQMISGGTLGFRFQLMHTRWSKRLAISSILLTDYLSTSILLLFFFVKAIMAASCGWYGYVFLLINCWLAAFTTEAVFLVVAGLVKAGLTKLGTDVEETHVDEVLIAAATILLLAATGISALDVVTMATFMVIPWIGSKWARRQLR